MRLRDLAGLIVIDFIDMEEPKNDRVVEKRMKDNLRFDRARVQMGKISGFGLLELSRQRRRTGVLEGTSHVCEHCQGSGRVRSVESASLALLRALDEAAAKQKNHLIEARTASDVAIYLLNEKRDALSTIEENRHVRVRVGAASAMNPGDFEINIGAGAFEDEPEEAEAEAAPARGRAQQRRDVEREAEEADAQIEDIEDVEIEADDEETEATPRIAAESDSESEDRKRRRRRGRRGGKRRRDGDALEAEVRGEDADRDARQPAAAAPEDRGDRGRNGKRRRRGRGRGRRVYEVDGGEWLDFVSADLKHLTPRPERPARNGDARRAAPVAEESADLSKTEAAEIIVHPAVAEPVSAPKAAPAREQEPEIETHVAAAAAEVEPVADAPSYEPDQERRDKFFSRLSRWSKKN
jgi:ribonuclease E